MDGYLLNEFRNLVRKLKRENQERSDAMNTGKLSDYGHSAKTHEYNNTLHIIKDIEKIIGTVQ